MAKNKPNQGAKKTETLTLRLDPKIKFLIEIMARNNRQSITGAIETAVIEFARNKKVRHPDWKEGGNCESFLKDSDLWSFIGDIWQTDESSRFASLCFYAPDLLSYEELRLWETITDGSFFWDEDRLEHICPDTLDFIKLSEHWDALLEHVEKYASSKVRVPYDPK